MVAGQLVVLVVVALVLGWRPAYTVGSLLASVALVVLGAATFVALALLLAGRLRAEATLAVANLVYVVLLVGGGLVVGVARYPRVLQPVVEALPTAALGEGLRAGAGRACPGLDVRRARRLAGRRRAARPADFPVDSMMGRMRCSA